jgi:hypothetical protein
MRVNYAIPGKPKAVGIKIVTRHALLQLLYDSYLAQEIS